VRDNRFVKLFSSLLHV